MTIELSIIAPAAGNVQRGAKKKQKRIKRDCIAANDVDPSVNEVIAKRFPNTLPPRV